jgi:hypothetical protein
MSRKFVLGVLIAASLALGGWALAQQGGQVPAQAERGPFAVSPAGQSAVLLDTKSGKTWVLNRSVEGESVWLPAKRIDSEIQAKEWRQEQQYISKELAEREKKKKSRNRACTATAYVDQVRILRCATLLEQYYPLAILGTGF